MKQILIADDEAPIRRLLQRFFEGIGHQVRVAANGKEALQSIRESRPDVLVSDLAMPDLNGIRLLEILREERNVPPLAILFSGYIPEPVRIQAQALGAEVVEKGGIGELLEKIEDLDQKIRE